MHWQLRSGHTVVVQASIYRCEADGGISLVQVYVDENVRTVLYTVTCTSKMCSVYLGVSRV